MAKKSDIEGPCTENSQLFKPDGATAMPTKHYPSSGKLGESKGKCSIEGPATAAGEDKGYHK